MTLLSELVIIREAYVNDYVSDHWDINYPRCTYGDGPSIHEIALWTNEAYLEFRTLYPEVNNLFIGHDKDHL